MSYAVSIQSSAQVFSGNIARPGGVLSSDMRIPDPEAQRIRGHWEAAFSNGQHGRTAILSGGLKWTPLLPITAEDAQLIEARQWSVGDVARIFGVSPWLLGDSTRMTVCEREGSNQ